MVIDQDVPEGYCRYGTPIAPNPATRAAIARALDLEAEDLFPINEPDPKAGPVKTSDENT